MCFKKKMMLMTRRGLVSFLKNDMVHPSNNEFLLANILIISKKNLTNWELETV